MAVVRTQSLRADPYSARLARRFVESTLASWDVVYLIDTASLLMSELVTNAVLHADSDIELRLAREADMIRFEVQDRGSGKPVRRRAAPEETSGRGLELVESLSAAWGVDAMHAGKAVWFELPT